MIKENIMAYFSNSSEGACFIEQCLKCRYGKMPCVVATNILNDLVKNDGTCEMFVQFKGDFEVKKGG